MSRDLTFQVSQLSKIRKPSLTVPTPKSFAKSTLGHLGYTDETCGFWAHTLIRFVLLYYHFPSYCTYTHILSFSSTFFFLSLSQTFSFWLSSDVINGLPEFIVTGRVKAMHEDIRRRALAVRECLLLVFHFMPVFVILFRRRPVWRRRTSNLLMDWLGRRTSNLLLMDWLGNQQEEIRINIKSANIT